MSAQQKAEIVEPGGRPTIDQVAVVIANFVRMADPAVGDVVQFTDICDVVEQQLGRVKKAELHIARGKARDRVRLGNPSYEFSPVIGYGWRRVEGVGRWREGKKRERIAARQLWRSSKIYAMADRTGLTEEEQRVLDHAHDRVERKRAALRKERDRMPWPEEK